VDSSSSSSSSSSSEEVRLYPFVTLQYSPTTLYQVSDHVQQLFCFPGVTLGFIPRRGRRSRTRCGRSCRCFAMGGKVILTPPCIFHS
jgi:hypothetical protein